MKDLMCVNAEGTLREAVGKLHKNGYGALFVLDTQGKMIGLLTDADVRKAILNNADFENPLEEMMNRKFFFAKKGRSRKSIVGYLRKI